MTSGTGLVWADGTVIDEASATVGILSHAVQRGSTVFDVLADWRPAEGDLSSKWL